MTCTKENQVEITMRPTYLLFPGPALMAEWSNTSSVTPRYDSPQLGFKLWLGHVRRLPLTWVKAVVFAGYYRFLQHSQLASLE